MGNADEYEVFVRAQLAAEPQQEVDEIIALLMPMRAAMLAKVLDVSVDTTEARRIMKDSITEVATVLGERRYALVFDMPLADVIAAIDAMAAKPSTPA